MADNVPGLNLNFDVQDLATAINASLGINPVRTEGAAIGVLSEFGSDKCIGGATVGAATLGLFTFRVSHKKIIWSQPQVKRGSR